MYFLMKLDEESNIVGKVAVENGEEVTTKQLKEIVSDLQNRELHSLYKLYVDTGQEKRKQIVQTEARKRKLLL